MRSSSCRLPTSAHRQKRSARSPSARARSASICGLLQWVSIVHEFTVDHPASRRVENNLKECFEAIAERYVDDTEGPVIKELVELLVSADEPLLSSLAWVVRNEHGAAEALRNLQMVSPEVRQRFIDLLNTLTPTPHPIDVPNRATKKETP